MKLARLIAPLLAAAILSTGIVFVTGSFAAGDEEKGERHERREREERGEGRERGFPPIDNAAYRQECSSCHFLYQPGLLPKRSWEALLKNTGKHFGEDLGLDEKIVMEITGYLTANSAERSRTEWSRKILDSLRKTEAPLRITEAPYIVRKHREVGAEVFKRPSVKSFSNCGACHTRGADGDFEEDYVKIPK